LIIEVDKKKVFASDAGLTFDINKETVILLDGSGQSHVVWSSIKRVYFFTWVLMYLQ
jgi:hypothetical protein